MTTTVTAIGSPRKAVSAVPAQGSRSPAHPCSPSEEPHFLVAHPVVEGARQENEDMRGPRLVAPWPAGALPLPVLCRVPPRTRPARRLRRRRTHFAASTTRLSRSRDRAVRRASPGSPCPVRSRCRPRRGGRRWAREAARSNGERPARRATAGRRASRTWRRRMDPSGPGSPPHGPSDGAGGRAARGCRAGSVARPPAPAGRVSAETSAASACSDSGSTCSTTWYRSPAVPRSGSDDGRPRENGRSVDRDPPERGAVIPDAGLKKG